MRCCYLSLVALAYCARASTPTQKVIDLLTGLQEGVKKEGEAEAANYESFSCFCKEKSTEVSSNIKTGASSVDDLSATLEAKTAERADSQVKLKDASAQQSKLTTELKETEVRCEKEHMAYMANDADLVKAIYSLEKAHKSLNEAQREPAPSKAGLLTVRSHLAKNNEIEAAMRLLSDGPHWISASFLQTQLHTSVDPADPAYKFHSDALLKTLAKLREDFAAKKKTADEEWGKTLSTCETTKGDLNKLLLTTNGEVDSLTAAIASITLALGQARASLVEEEAGLKENKLYLGDLTALCEKRAKEFDQRTTLRAGELKAMSAALELLTGTISKTEQVNKRTMLLRSPSFLQVGSHQVSRHGRESALELLRSEASRLASVALSSIVARVAADPFGNVKGLIQKLLERLIAESTEEATKKGFCDTEMGKAERERDYRWDDARKLTAEIEELKVKQQSFDLEIAQLGSSLEGLGKALEDAANQRESERKENADAIRQATEGLQAVSDAITILKNFYKEASNAAASLLQLEAAASPVDASAPGAGFDGVYTGKTAESQGIIGLLEVIKSDFERTLSSVDASEKEAAAAFVVFERDGKAAAGGKSTKLQLDAADLAATKLTGETKSKELKESLALVDAALQKIAELKPLCIDNVMTYEDRIAKRDQEVAALKRAVCLLDTEGVEVDFDCGPLE